MNAASTTLLQKAVAMHSQGLLAPAAAAYREVLGLDPGQPDALHLLGVALTQSGQAELGAPLIERSLSINAVQPVALANLGNAYLASGRWEAALGSFDRSIALSADYAPAHNGRGNALAALQRHEEAVASFGLALRLNPGMTESRCNRGLALAKLCRFAEARADADAVLALQPRHPPALLLRTEALVGAQFATDALAALDQLPAAAGDPARIHFLRGQALRQLGRIAEAVAAYRLAVDARPDFGEAQLFLGTLAMSQRQFELAASAFARLLELAPAQDFVRGALLHARLQIFDWADYDESVRTILGEFEAGGLPDQPFSFLAVSDSPEAQHQCARRLQERLQHPKGAVAPPSAPRNASPPDECGRVRRPSDQCVRLLPLGWPSKAAQCKSKGKIRISAAVGFTGF